MPFRINRPSTNDPLAIRVLNPRALRGLPSIDTSRCEPNVSLSPVRKRDRTVRSPPISADKLLGCVVRFGEAHGGAWMTELGA